VPDRSDLEPLDSAESLWRAIRKEVGLSRPGRVVVAAVAIGAGLAAMGGGMYEFVAGGKYRGLLADAVFFGAPLAGLVLVLLAIGMDAGVRRAFRRGRTPAPPVADPDAALLEAWELGMDDAGWTDAVMARAEQLLPTLIAAGYAETEGRTWRFTDAGAARAEELLSGPARPAS
jgi:hypothetical protein